MCSLKMTSKNAFEQNKSEKLYSSIYILDSRQDSKPYRHVPIQYSTNTLTIKNKNTQNTLIITSRKKVRK